MEKFKIETPSDDIEEILIGVAKKSNLRIKGGQYDVFNAALMFVRMFRTGKMGNFFFKKNHLKLLE
eukprot:m.241067 g.241067  ORF g.241067 m.241067 type:complete len:66 (-) comp17596_c0_seq1:22-219(-)